MCNQRGEKKKLSIEFIKILIVNTLHFLISKKRHAENKLMGPNSNDTSLLMHLEQLASRNWNEIKCLVTYKSKNREQLFKKILLEKVLGLLVLIWVC